MKLRLFPAFFVCLAACGSDPVPPGADAGGVDAAVVESDGGVRALCTMLAAPACSASSACGAPVPAPADCPGCRARYANTCSFGACETPDMPAVLVSVAADVTEVRGAMPRSFVLTAIAGETAGGLELSCADLLPGATMPVALDDPCLTVMESRRWNLGELRPTGEIYSLFSSQFPTSHRVLFLVEAYSGPLGADNVVGNGCVEMPAGVTQDANGKVSLSAGTIHRL